MSSLFGAGRVVRLELNEVVDSGSPQPGPEDSGGSGLSGTIVKSAASLPTVTPASKLVIELGLPRHYAMAEKRSCGRG